MKELKIKNYYNKKISLIKKYNFYYYNKNKSLVSDYEYDILKKEIINLEAKFNFLNSEHSPAIAVGYKPSKNFKKILHRVPMLSLSKTL